MTSRTRIRWRLLTGALLVLGLLLPCSLQAQGDKNTLRAIMHADLKNLDPIWTTARITAEHGWMIYDTLFAMDDKLEVHPQMVERYQVSSDAMTYTFTLRPGLLWHDGKPVTAADCVASIKRWGKRDGLGQKLIAATRSLEVVNDRTFRLTLGQPFGLVLRGLGKVDVNVPFMMPERMANTDAFAQVKEQIGSGPFKFVPEEWKPGNRVVYVKNADYKPRPEPPSFTSGGKVARMERVEWLYIPDHNTAMSALITGEADYFELPPVDLVPVLKRNADIRIIRLDPLGRQGMLRPNSLLPPFNNKKARQALAWMVNQEDYLRSAIGNPDFYRVCPALYGCGTPYESTAGTEALVHQDFDKARQLLKEAGYKGERVVVMDPTDTPDNHALTLVTAQLLRKIGVNVEVQAMDWSTLTSRRPVKKGLNEGGWNIFHTSWPIYSVNTPLAIAMSGGCTESAWFGWPCNKEVEALRDAWTKTSDPKKQKEIAIELQKKLMDEVFYVNLGNWVAPTAIRKNVKGIVNGESAYFWNIYKE